MFYNKKYIFFAVLYALSFVLYYFINKQIMLTVKSTAAVFIYSLIIFAAIILISFLSALLISLLYKYSYALLCKMFKLKQRAMAFKIFWALFTAFCYIIAAAVFFQTTQY